MLPLQSLQSSLTDINTWRTSRTDGFSTTTSGTAGARPSASTGRTSTRLGVFVCEQVYGMMLIKAPVGSDAKRCVHWSVKVSVSLGHVVDCGLVGNGNDKDCEY